MDSFDITGSKLIALSVCLLLGTAVYLTARHSIWFKLNRRAKIRAGNIQDRFDRMFKEVSLNRCLWIVWGGPIAGAVIALALTSHLVWPAVVGFTVLAVVIGWFMPLPLIGMLYNRYLGRIEDQLVDALTMMSNGLRSGLSLPQVMDQVAREMAPPMSHEIGLTLREHRMGKSIDESLEALFNRVPSQDLRLAVNSILILRETGGNLAEIFDTIVYTIVERDKVRGKIKTMTAQGTAQGVILISMPFVMMLLLNWINPSFLQPMFETALGWIMLAFMTLMLFLGGLMIRKIVKIEV